MGVARLGVVGMCVPVLGDKFSGEKRGEELLLVLQSPLGFESSSVGGGKETDVGGKETDVGGKETDVGGKETDVGGKETDVTVKANNTA